MNPFTAKLEYVSFALKMTTGEAIQSNDPAAACPPLPGR